MSADATTRATNPHPTNSSGGGLGDRHQLVRNVNIGDSRLSISVDMPKALVAPLIKIKRAFRPARQTLGRVTADQLSLSHKIPKLHLQKRDLSQFLPFFQSFHDAGSNAPTSSLSSDLARQIAGISWYHTIELPDGHVTPGIFDHRKLVPNYGIPADLSGKRVLDVATFDGFWAFEFERRGATVTALDIGRISQCDFPPVMRDAFVREGLDRDTGEGFRLAHEALHSNVDRVECSVYDLNPESLGMFDVVHVGDLLLHLENPIAALRSIRSVTRGRALISDCVDPSLGPGLTRYFGGWESVVWWLPSLDTLAQMIIDAGFSDVGVHALYSLGSEESRGTVWRAAMLATP